MNTSDVICGTINGVDISGLYNYTHVVVHDVNDKLSDLTSDILTLQDLLREQKDAIEREFAEQIQFYITGIRND